MYDKIIKKMYFVRKIIFLSLFFTKRGNIYKKEDPKFGPLIIKIKKTNQGKYTKMRNIHYSQFFVSKAMAHNFICCIIE